MMDSEQNWSFAYSIWTGDPSSTRLQFKRLYAGVRQKLEAMMRHDLYSLYKSGADEGIRAKARQEYLDAIGLSDSFRWGQGQDVNVTHSDADIF